jgi:hypothetical protein
MARFLKLTAINGPSLRTGTPDTKPTVFYPAFDLCPGCRQGLSEAGVSQRHLVSERVVTSARLAPGGGS